MRESLHEYVKLPKGGLVQAVRGSEYPVVLMLMWFGGGRVGDFGKRLEREGIIDECRKMVAQGGKLVIVIHRARLDPNGSFATTLPGIDALVDLCHPFLEDDVIKLYPPKESDMNERGFRNLARLLA